jgi:cell fate regulator YaaT (PSP1 superfamily)
MDQYTDKNIDQEPVEQEKDKSNENHERSRGKCCRAEHHTKLPTFNWLKDIPKAPSQTDVVEVRFKNTRKEFFQNINHIRLTEGDIVAVEASPGHDIGIVSLTGDLVWKKLRKNEISPEETEFKKIYRKAKESDIEKWREAVALEHKTMIKARKLARGLNLDMKIGDVEYQGDKTKAIFYYIAEERVDFRELIKVLAEEFKIRIEMRQIGTRQESGRIGGIGSCGRELCCSKWICNFVSVTTNSARHQELSLNPQKLAGQCGKLKCCLNFELDCYLDAKKEFPDTSEELHTKQGTAYHQKTDIFRKILWYSFNKECSENLIPVTVDRVKEIVEINRKGESVESLVEVKDSASEGYGFENDVGQESADRFNKKNNNNKKRKSKRNKKRRKNRSNEKKR